MQLYCISYLRKYKLGRDKNGNRKILTENRIKLKNGFELHRKSLEDIDYSWKIFKNIFPLKYSLEIEIFKKVLQSDNGYSKAQGDSEDSEADIISFKIF